MLHSYLVKRLMLALLLGMVSLSAVFQAQPASAAPRQRCFPETGYCVSGPILAYWERNGGLPVFGFPIADQQVETIEGSWTGPVQWFQRDRLEDHANEGLGVLAGRLGARYLELQGTPWQTLPAAAGPGDPNSCRFFSETGHMLCQPFLAYWERNGGLARFGYPISEKYQETVEGAQYWVQYFERRRMEQHPENAGTPYEVLLGLLGTDVYRSEQPCDAWFFSPAPKYCPLAPIEYREGAAERFEHGFLLWTREPDRFYIFLDDGRYWIVAAPYTFQPAPTVDEKPPSGRYKPVSGFGDLWRGAIAVNGNNPLNEPLRPLLGWAVEREHGYRTEFQCHGGATYAEQRCYLRGPSGEVVWFGPYGSGRSS
jgi:hypothetical protein